MNNRRSTIDAIVIIEFYEEQIKNVGVFENNDSGSRKAFEVWRELASSKTYKLVYPVKGTFRLFSDEEIKAGFDKSVLWKNEVCFLKTISS